MISYLIEKGHLWHDIMDVYPINVVKNFCNAGRKLEKFNHSQLVLGLSIAVTHSLDLAFNSGRGQVLKKYFREMERKEIIKEQIKGRPEGKGAVVDAKTWNFFMSLPRKD